MTMRMEDVVIVVGLTVVQLVFWGNSIMLSYLMSLGLNPLAFAITSALATSLLLSPFALSFERSLWPAKFTFKLTLLFLSAAVGGVTLFQTLFMRGIHLTSATMGTAMPNLCPGFTFVIAWIMRLEKVDLNCVYSRVKILGTVLCVSGALILSLIHSKAADEPLPLPPSAKDITFDQEKIVGCLYLLAAILALSSLIILQAVILIEFPAPMSVCGITSLIGSLTTLAALLLEGNGFNTAWANLSPGRLAGFSFLGGAVGAGGLSFHVWVVKKRGPVLASIFNPISTVCSVIFSVVTSQETISLPSLGGMALLFTGLYLVLWSKGKEGRSYSTITAIRPIALIDEEKPLLS
ncbi:hypothetical protein MLD38_038908 [Melastoma candidum]|uniref:Uncharacterized protein n=1 Tax=Melastoma candidum TaxID=119954 RepID=A0ACB9L1F3_9MYRT|nr:hypothetical protein MLD38_038908 [Melastoma candidum]